MEHLDKEYTPSKLGLPLAFGLAAGRLPADQSSRKYPPPFSLRLTFEERTRLEREAGAQSLGAYIGEALSSALISS